MVRGLVSRLTPHAGATPFSTVDAFILDNSIALVGRARPPDLDSSTADICRPGISYKNPERIS